MKVLLINLARLGDLVQTSPASRGLKNQYNAEVHMLVEGSLCDFARGLDGVDKVLAFDEKDLCDGLINNSKSLVNSYKNWKRLVDTIKSEKYDLVVNLTHDKVSSRLTALSGAKEIYGRFEYPNGAAFVNNKWLQYFFAALTNRNVNAFNLCDIYRLGSGCEREIDSVKYLNNIKLNEELKGLILPSDKGLVLIHPGANRVSKQWLPNRFAELADCLTNKGYGVALTGSPAEKDLAEDINSLCKNDITILSGKTSLAEFPALLKQADLLLTNDTGPLHLAAAVGTKTLSIFLAYVRPEDTAPYGNGHIVIETNHPQHPTLESDLMQVDGFADTIPVDAVLEASLSILEKREIDTNKLRSKEGSYRICQTSKDDEGLQYLDTLFSTKPDDIRPIKTEIMRKFWKKLLLNADEETSNKFAWDQLEVQLIEKFRLLIKRWEIIISDQEKVGNLGSHLLAIESEFQSLESMHTDLTGLFIVQRLQREYLYHKGHKSLVNEGRNLVSSWLVALELLEIKSLEELEVA